MSAETILFYNEFSSPSRKVLIALLEKKVTFERCPISLVDGEQLERWYLDLNPRGEVPVLKHGDDVIPESSTILEYIDKNFGRPCLLYPVESSAAIRSLISRIDAIPMVVLTFGVACFQASGLTECLRHPFSTHYDLPSMRQKLIGRPLAFKLVAEKNRGTPSEAVFEEKAKNFEHLLGIMSDRRLFLQFLDKVENLLDHVESELSSESRMGPWLFGPTFSAADITLTTFLVRLYQLGLDERFWLGGRRPHLSVYQELAFRRPSVEKATEWKAREKDVVRVNSDFGNGDAGTHVNNGLDAATMGLGAILVLGGIYACKKLLRK